MTFTVDIVLKGRDFAVSETCVVARGAPGTWDDEAVRDVLVEILRAIDRAANPGADAERPVTLHGFSWIVEPADGRVVIAIEIPMGAAVAGPFDIGQADLDTRIARVLQSERRPGAATVH